MLYFVAFVVSFLRVAFAHVLPASVQHNGREISLSVYESLEELARIVDIAYCVGTTGIQKPFKCLSRCNDFQGFDLVTTWNTGPQLSDSCGYIVVSHAPFKKRVIVAFRGTYSIANTIVDLSTNPAQYAPFPDDSDDDTTCTKHADSKGRQPLLPQLLKQNAKRAAGEKCDNCTVHSGFMNSWRNTRCTIIPHVEQALKDYPEYELVLVGHSLGGAVAALAALEFQARGWTPHVTTFGEPRIGNRELAQFIDKRFNLSTSKPEDALYHRVTHVNDPVPLLPFEEWGYVMHGGEVYISKSSTPPAQRDLHYCNGDQDVQCIQEGTNPAEVMGEMEADDLVHTEVGWIPTRYKLWQLFFAHRDYFWRLGLCVPGGDPWDWFKTKYAVNGTVDEL